MEPPMTARRVPGADAWALCCDAPDREARCTSAATYRGAVQAGAAAGWAVTVSTTDPTVIDLCERHRALAERRST